MILLSSDLNVLAADVHEGRRTLANILKYVRMGTSSNFGTMLSMALASVVLPFLPLLPLQILLNNLLHDLSEIGIPFGCVDDKDVATLFQTIWFLKSITTQILVIFAIRSSRLSWNTSRPPQRLWRPRSGIGGSRLPGARAISRVVWIRGAALVRRADDRRHHHRLLMAAEASKHFALAASGHAATQPPGARGSGFLRRIPTFCLAPEP